MYQMIEYGSALRLVELESMVNNLPGKLDNLVAEGGKILVFGERQLMCIARSYLMENAPILLLDEATAASDAKTDQLIQSSIRLLFGKKLF